MNFLYTDLMYPVLFSILCSTIIGVEREIKTKDAGLKTSIFITIGSCVFAFIGSEVLDSGDRSRVIAQIIQGIGFIGGGVIIFVGDKIRGITSASIIWMLAGIGILCGMHRYKEALLLSITIVILDNGIDRAKKFFSKEEK